jgi:hypothetical protein
MLSFGWLQAWRKKDSCTLITNLRIKKKNFVVGPEYFALAITAVVSAVTGGTWTANKVLERQQERIQQAFKYTDSQKRRIDTLEDQVNRMPMEYVLKVDFLREIKEMHDNFREINNKLDKLMEKLLSK